MGNTYTSKQIAITGAGPAGMTAAYELAKKQYQVDIYEAQTNVGGMSRPIRLWDCQIDLGAHRFFSTNRQINKLWLEVAGNACQMVNRQTRLLYRNRSFDYPLRSFNTFRNLGLLEAINCLISYVYQQVFSISLTGGFESWGTNRFGKRLYRMFVKHYSEKLWGITCTDIHSPELKVRPIAHFRNWLPSLYGTSKDTILSLEPWCNDLSEWWHRSNRSLLELATADLRKTGLIANRHVLDGHIHRILRCYPIYAKGYRDALTPVQESLSHITNLYPIGRYGSCPYNNQNHSILIGILAAQKLTTDQQVDLWAVNTDYETNQGSTVITETGLEKQ